jgi:hypothetical protein
MSFIGGPPRLSSAAHQGLVNVNPQFRDETTTHNMRQGSSRWKVQAQAYKRHGDAKNSRSRNKNKTLKTFASMSMHELQAAVESTHMTPQSDTGEQSAPAQTASSPPTDEHTCHITNASFVENLGMLWEVALWHGPKEANDNELTATLLSPPVPRDGSAVVQLPQRGSDGSKSERWQLRIKSEHIAFQGGARTLDVQPGQSVTVCSALESPEMEQLEIIQLFTLATRHIEGMSGRSGKVSELMSDEVWKQFANSLQSGRSAAQLRNAFQTTRLVAASQGWVVSPHWLTVHAAPPVQPVPTTVLLRLLSSQQCKLQVSWRKLANKAGGSNKDAPSDADLITVQATMMLVAGESGQGGGGITVRTFRNLAAQGTSFESCGPVRVRPFSTGRAHKRRGTGFHSAVQLLQHGVRNVVRCEPAGDGNSHSINSIAPMEHPWDSIEVLLFANPGALVEVTDVTADVTVPESEAWPVVFRAHQYAAPIPEDTMSELKLSKVDVAVGQFASSVSSLMGVGDPGELLNGSSKLARILHKDPAATRQIHSADQWDSLMPLFLNW